MMEEARKSPNVHRGNKKMVIKARGGGGGIGAVVMFGGALATAALFSAFAVRHKRRSSGEDSSPEINEKCENYIMSGGGEEVELGNDSAVMSYDQSFELDDEGKVENDAENDAVSDGGFIIVNEKIPFLAEKFKVELVKEDVSNNHSKEEDAEVEMQPRQEINAVEEVRIDQTKEFEGFCSGNGEINDKKCIEKTILPLLESPIQEDDLVDEQVRGAKFSLMQFDGKKIIKNEDEEDEVENIEAAMVNGGSESIWEAPWETESTHQVKLMNYEVGQKIEEDKNMVIKKDEQAMRVIIIWVICVLTSLLSSWFFDLSFVKMGLFVFLTVFLLEIYGFSVLNRQHDYVYMI